MISGRFEEIDEILTAATEAQGSDHFVTVHQKSKNMIFECVKVKSVLTEVKQIEFDFSKLELSDQTIAVRDIVFLQVHLN